MRPIHQSWQAADDSRDVIHWFSFLTPIPFSLAGTNRLVVPVRPYVVEAAPGLAPNPGLGLPPASTDHCDDQRRAPPLARNISASWRTPEFIEAKQIQASVAGHDAGKDTFVGGFDEFVDQLGGGDVADSASLFASREAKPDEQVGFAGAGVAEQHDGLAGVHVVPGGELPQRCGCEPGTASMLNSANRFTLGNLASLTRRARRRSVRSSTSAARTSAR